MLRGSANLEHLDASVFDFASILDLRYVCFGL